MLRPSALMSAPKQLWEPLDDQQKHDVLLALRTSRQIELMHDNNWWLFPAMVEAALWDLGADHVIQRIQSAVEQMESWYLGDGVYGDGPGFHWDYYNSYVIHPMLLQVLRVPDNHGQPIGNASLPRAMHRGKRYAEVLERLISPEGTFPVMGRSLVYRFASMYHLAGSGLIMPPPGALFIVGLDLAMARIIAEADPAEMADAVLAAMNDEAVQLLIAPAQADLQRGMQVSDAGVAADEHAARVCPGRSLRAVVDVCNAAPELPNRAILVGIG